MPASFFKAGAVALVTSLALVGCSDGSGPDAGAGTLSVLLTDAPGDILAAVVTIEEIYLQGDDGRVVLSSIPTTTDLLTLANSTQTLVQDAVVPAGTYGQLRLVVSGGFLEVENGDGGTDIYASSPTYAGLPAGAQVAGLLQMPSFAQSGLKVTLPGDMLTIATEQVILLVDFDVSQSFGKISGRSDRWTMHPVIRATEITASGSILASLELDTGVSLPTLGGTPATLADFEAVLTDAATNETRTALTDQDADGIFEGQFFAAAGSYTVHFEAPTGMSFTTDLTTPVAVDVVSGEQVSVSAKVTGATAP
jgi:hypothetical protein